ncbi:MAG TPA: hypothetical protein VNM91_04830 [Dehalococcoidia bacterium]|nr:hypothetical protein [Dehalococcoidia bacterium]
MNSASRRNGERLRIVVLGYVVRCPIGGVAWHYMQYAIGLAALGHDVWYVEDSGDDEWACYDPGTGLTGPDPAVGLRFAADAFARAGFGDRWAYHDALGGSWHGPAAHAVVDACRTADLVINVSHANVLRPWLLDVPVRVLIDTDPAFTQLRHLTDDARLRRALLHNAFFTFGENIGRSSSVPGDGLRWLPTRQPVALHKWRVTPGRPGAPFTTVMQWDAYPAIEHRGTRYGMKSDGFEEFLSVPARTEETLEMALGGESAPRRRLERHGWKLRNSLEPTRDPWTYQRYIRSSKGEFSVAKHGYVAARSGWFSERTAAYLASGRPAVVQDTGFSDWLSTGLGVVGFTTADEAVEGLRAVSGSYEAHCKAAREIAEAYFDGRTVLSNLIDSARAVAKSRPVGPTGDVA